MYPTYDITRDTSFALALQIVSGSVLGTEPVTAKIKPVGLQKEVPGDEVASVKDFAVAFVPAAGGELAYWVFSLTAVDTAALPVGKYISDARIEVAGSVMRTTPVLLNVINGVS